MFLQDLTPDQQATFFRAAGLLIAADARHDQTEVDLLEAAQMETALEEVPALMALTVALPHTIGTRANAGAAPSRPTTSRYPDVYPTLVDPYSQGPGYVITYPDLLPEMQYLISSNEWGSEWDVFFRQPEDTEFGEI